MPFKKIVVGFVLIAILSTSIRANSLINGSFENVGNTVFLGYGYLDYGYTLPGWSRSGYVGINPGPIDASTAFANNGVVPDGTNTVFLQGDAWISQDVTLRTNVNYKLTFRKNSRSGTDGYGRLEVLLGTTVLMAKHEISPVGGFNSYYIRTISFTVPNDGIYTLTFRGYSDEADRTVLLDNIALFPEAIAYWALEETGGNTAYDQTSRANHLTYYNSPTYNTPGMMNYAIGLNGQSQYAKRGNDSDFTPGTQSWTVEAWFKTSTSAKGYIFAWNPIASDNNQSSFYGLRIEQGHVVWQITDSSSISASLISSLTLNDNKWHHAVGVLIQKPTGTDEINLYIDGQLDQSDIGHTLGSLLSVNGAPVTIGASLRSLRNRSTPENYFGGTIDDVVVYNSALNLEEIVARFKMTSFMIDSFQSASVWTSLPDAAQTPQPAVVDGSKCQTFPSVFTTGTLRGSWEKPVNIDFTDYDFFSFRIKVHNPAKVKMITLYFAKADGTTCWACYTTTPIVYDRWQTVVVPKALFYPENSCNNWHDIRKIQISVWQAQPGNCSVSIADFKVKPTFGNENILINSGFEVCTTEGLPDFWGTGHWGLRYEPWVTDTNTWQNEWGVDNAVSHSGSRSLRITKTSVGMGLLDFFNEKKVTSTWITLEPGKQYTLSAWMKSDGSMPFHMSFSDTYSLWDTVGSTWHNYTLSNITPTTTDHLSCSIIPDGQGTLWIDDVKLEASSSVTDYQPSLMDQALTGQAVHRSVPPVSDITMESQIVVTNGNFEASPIPGDYGLGVPVGWSGGPAWNVGVNPSSTGSSAFANNGQIPEGTHVVFIQKPGSIYQVVSGFVIGQRYKLCFNYNARSGGAWPNLITTLTPPSGTVFTWNDLTGIEPVGGTNPYYLKSGYEFIAENTTYTLKFETQAADDATVLLDDIKFVPGPSTIQLAIDQSRRFMVNGQPFIPFAEQWESPPSPAVLNHIARSGFNTIYFLVMESNSVQQLRTTLDNAQANGLKAVIIAPNNVSTTTLQNWVAGLRDHPALIAWNVFDEPQSQTQLDEAETKYNLAKFNDTTGRPILINYLSYTTNKIGDIASMDEYNLPNGSPALMIGNVSLMETAAMTANPPKPSWIAVQSTGYSYCYSREPSGPEAECMTYLTLIHGARGLMYFVHKTHSLELWNQLRLLSREVQTLTPVFYSLETPSTLSVTPDTISAVIKTYQGQKYIIAVNQQASPTNATFTTSSGGSSAEVLFENRQI